MSGQGRVEEAGNPAIVLSVLTSVERDSALTQRQLARDLGIALGLANAYLRRCVRKGLVKMRQAPLNRYAYYLTPQGFAEKSRLTAEYLSVSLAFFRRARADCARLFRDGEARGWRYVALYGAGDLAEIAVLSAAESGVEPVCVIDREQMGRRCAGLTIEPDLVSALRRAGLRGLDAIILTDTGAPQASFAELCRETAANGMAADRIAVPALLRISPEPLAAGAWSLP